MYYLVQYNALMYLILYLDEPEVLKFYQKLFLQETKLTQLIVKYAIEMRLFESILQLMLYGDTAKIDQTRWERKHRPNFVYQILSYLANLIEAKKRDFLQRPEVERLLQPVAKTKPPPDYDMLESYFRARVGHRMRRSSVVSRQTRFQVKQTVGKRHIYSSNS